MTNSSAVYARINTTLKENAETLLAQQGISLSVPTAIGAMSQEQLNEEFTKGMESFHRGSYTADEINKELASEFGI